MNIIQARTATRLQRIKELKNSIEQAELPDYKRLAMLACSEWGVTLRTANELIKIARFQIDGI